MGLDKAWGPNKIWGPGIDLLTPLENFLSEALRMSTITHTSKAS